MGEAEGVSGLRGRARELAVLVGAFRQVSVGRAGAVLVGGDAGVGKSSLIAELVQHARQRDAVVLVGNAIDIADPPPFWPVLSAVRGAVRAAPDDHTAATLREWVERLPQTRDAEGAGTAPPVPMLDLLTQLIMELAEQRSVVLVIEDLQWADRSTRDLVAYLVASLTHEPVLVVGTYRNDSPGSTPGLTGALAELRRHQKVTAMEVAPFPRAVVAELVAEWAPDRPELEELVWERSVGNAFIAEETVRAVLGGDALGLPTTLREIVLSRVALLTPAARQVVRAIAVGVGPLRHQLLAAVVDLPAADLLESIREAVAHGIASVDENGDGYRLRHGLMTEVVAADLLPGERIDLHRRYALALSGSQTSPHSGFAAQIAHHWYEADEPEQALLASVAAAQASEGIHAHSEAYRHWLRAAELVPLVSGESVIGREACLDRAARAAELAGDHDVAVKLLDQLLGDQNGPSGLPAALLHARKGRALAALGLAAEAEQTYRAAAALLPLDGAEAERAQVLAAHSGTLLHAMDFAGARSVAMRALALVPRTKATTVEARILAVLGFSLAYLEDASAGAAAIAEGLAVAERTGEPEAIGEAYLRRAELLAGPLNQLVEGIDFARQGVERMRSLGLARTAGVALLTYAANALFRQGRWEDAQRAVADAWELAPSGAAALDVRLARCRIDLGQGRLDAAAADLEAVELLARSTSGPRQRIPLLILFSALELWRRRPTIALQHVDEGLVVAEAGADDLWSVAPLVWHGTRAWADITAAGLSPPTAQVERLRHHCAELAQRAKGTVPAVRAVIDAFILMCEAEMARAEGDSDPLGWERAADTWERHQHPYPAAYARMRQAEGLLARHPRRADATETLRRADAVARRLGARPLLDDIVDLAKRARISLEAPANAEAPVPAAVSATPLDSLTTREREVLHEIAKGLTNREIGQRLFISEKTVSVHVARIFAKIGVHNRMQASAFLQRSRPPL
jgi:DNA-binding CsgD family transcriptional regulator/tetratricopeptide (TPR) repeat protein